MYKPGVGLASAKGLSEIKN